MKKIMKVLPLSALILLAGSSLTSCSSSSDGPVLRIINSEDYIYLNDPESGYDAPDMVEQFKSYIKENYPQYKNLQVVYDTSDTNETLYSELQTGKSNYDLMNVSDYMAQKIVSGNYAVPFYQNGLTIDNYATYASKDIKDRLDNIVATKKVKNPETGKYEDQDVYLKDYSVGYMWGTLGILFNPDYPGFKVEKEELIEDMQSFSALWDKKYEGTISIKNSMRDTYALGLMHTFEEEFKELKEKFDSGEIDLETYQEEFAKIFNRCDENNVAKIQKSLEELKQNIFGLEVDSGKQDIVTKKIGVNLAWSGDAVYSMDQAEDETQVGSNTSEIYYSVPELGSNLWFDTWIMPNCPRSDAQYELAHLFLDFICDPANAAQNMEYTGYTSFIAGDSILELVRDWYDYRTAEIYEEEEYQIYSYNEASEEFKAIDYSDFLEENHEDSRQDDKLYYFVPEGEKEEPESFDDLKDNIVYKLDEEDEPTEEQKTYGDLTIVNSSDSEIEEVDLKYFFAGTLDEYTDDDAIFYSDCYLPFTKEGSEEPNISVGRQFFCQYPNKETLDRCGVMRDYGKNNTYVMKMWENFKSDPLPTWAIITLAVFVTGIVGLIGYFVTNKVLKKKALKKYSQKN